MLSELLSETRSSGTDADRVERGLRPSGAGLFYLASVALVAATTVAMLFGAGFFLLASPGSGMIWGTALRPGLETGIFGDSQPPPANDRRSPVVTSLEKTDRVQDSVGSPGSAAGMVDSAAKEGQTRLVQPGENLSVALPPAAAAAPSGLAATEISDLLERGDKLMSTGDVVSARLFYERAVAGDRRAALRLGASFDPAFLERFGLAKALADVEAARRWYERALELGLTDAKRHLENLATR